MKKYYPLMLDIQNAPCVVIGGGEVAYRKVENLLCYGAQVTVITDELSPLFSKFTVSKDFHWIQKNYEKGDLDGAFLAIVATDVQCVNEAAFLEAKEKRILVNVVDQPAYCQFIVPAVHTQGDLTLTVSTNGKSPVLARKIKEKWQKEFGSHYAQFLNFLGNIRPRVIKEVSDSSVRKSIFEKLVNFDYLNRLEQGETGVIEEMNNLLNECIEKSEEYTNEKEDCNRN